MAERVVTYEEAVAMIELIARTGRGAIEKLCHEIVRLRAENTRLRAEEEKRNGTVSNAAAPDRAEVGCDEAGSRVREGATGVVARVLPDDEGGAPPDAVTPNKGEAARGPCTQCGGSGRMHANHHGYLASMPCTACTDPGPSEASPLGIGTRVYFRADLPQRVEGTVVAMTEGGTGSTREVQWDRCPERVPLFRWNQVSDLEAVEPRSGEEAKGTAPDFTSEPRNESELCSAEAKPVLDETGEHVADLIKHAENFGCEPNWRDEYELLHEEHVELRAKYESLRRESAPVERAMARFHEELGRVERGEPEAHPQDDASYHATMANADSSRAAETVAIARDLAASKDGPPTPAEALESLRHIHEALHGTAPDTEPKR